MTDKNNNIVVGVVFHIPPENLNEARSALEKVPFLRIVYFKQSADKLWIVGAKEER